MKRPRTSGFALIEVLVATLVMAVALITLLQVQSQTEVAFLTAGDKHTGAWLAELKMNELISEYLPNPEDEETWELTGGGDFSELDYRLNALNLSVNPDWEERYTFQEFEYEWRKELIFVGADFIGNQFDLDAWEEPLDERGQVLSTVEDPREKPAARVVRVTLTVFLPDRVQARQASRDDEAAMGNRGQQTIKLVTYVDPAIVFDAETNEELTAGGAE